MTNTTAPRKARFGSVSSATMRPEDLIPTFASELEWLSAHDRTTAESDLLAEADGIEDFDSDEASEVLSALFDALNERAPAYGYFGASEGDGADYGFWTSEDALAELPRSDEGEPDEWLDVNDHGNATLYVRNADGTYREEWAIV